MFEGDLTTITQLFATDSDSDSLSVTHPNDDQQHQNRIPTASVSSGGLDTYNYGPTSEHSENSEEDTTETAPENTEDYYDSFRYDRPEATERPSFNEISTEGGRKRFKPSTGRKQNSFSPAGQSYNNPPANRPSYKPTRRPTPSQVERPTYASIGRPGGRSRWRGNRDPDIVHAIREKYGKKQVQPGINYWTKESGRKKNQLTGGNPRPPPETFAHQTGRVKTNQKLLNRRKPPRGGHRAGWDTRNRKKPDTMDDYSGGRRKTKGKFPTRRDDNQINGMKDNLVDDYYDYYDDYYDYNGGERDIDDRKDDLYDYRSFSDSSSRKSGQRFTTEADWRYNGIRRRHSELPMRLVYWSPPAPRVRRQPGLAGQIKNFLGL